MKLFFLIDPLPKLLPPGDTTLMVMKEAQRRGHQIACATHKDLTVFNGDPGANALPLEIGDDGFPRAGKPEEVSINDFDAVAFRHDPPFDLDYLHATQIIDLSKVPVQVNSPGGLRKANEKLYALNFPEAMPETIISRDKRVIGDFLRDMKEVVGKPLDSFGGIGVVLMRHNDISTPAIVDILTNEGQSPALFQRYVNGHDKRVFVIGGKLEGAMIRKGVSTDFRANMHVGGVPVMTTLTEEENARLDTIIPKLKADGLSFVGLDFIGGYLSEVNVTSPTGFYHFHQVSQINLAEKVVDLLEGR